MHQDSNLQSGRTGEHLPSWLVMVKSIVLLLAFQSHSGLAQNTSYGPGYATGKSKYTYPQAPKIKPAIDVPSPGAFIPTNPERYRFTIKNEIGGTKTTTGKVTVYTLNAGKLIPSGAIDPGSEIKLDYVRASGKLLYYGIPWSKNGKVDTLDGGSPTDPRFLAWVPGNYVEGSLVTP